MTQPPPAPKPLAVLPRELGQLPPDAALVGEKAARLSDLVVLKARVPRFGVVTTAAFEALLATAEVERLLAATRAAELDDEAVRRAHGEALERALVATPLPPGVEAAMGEVLGAFSLDDLLAVRASPAGKRHEVAALAGAFETLLFVRNGHEAVEAVRQCFASALSPVALAARHAGGLPPTEGRIAVVVQRMVKSEVSGAVSTAAPSPGGAGEAMLGVEATYGLSGGSSLGPGTRRIHSDRFRVTRSLDASIGLIEGALVEEEVIEKQEALRFDETSGYGTLVRPVPAEDRRSPALSGAQVRTLAEEALRLEAEVGRPLRLVFSFAGRLLHLLEARPLSAPGASVVSPRVRLWDQRLLPGGLAGPTTPLTYSLMRRTATRVAREALPVLGAKESALEARRSAAERLFGYVQGRVYANVTAFRGLLELVPWHSEALHAAARGFGVEDLVAGTPPQADESALASAASVRRLARLLRRVDDEAAALLQPARERLATLGASRFPDADPDRLLDHLDDVEELFTRTGTSLSLLSALSAAHYDLAHRLLVSSRVAQPQRLLNDLLGGEPSEDAVGLCRALSELVRVGGQEPEVAALLDGEGGSRVVLERLAATRAAGVFVALLEDTVERFGLQVMAGLKLESPTLRSDPELLLDLVRAWAKAPAPDLEALAATAFGTRKKAEYAIESHLRSGSLLGVTNPARLVLGIAERLRHALERRDQLRPLLLEAGAAARAITLALGERLLEHGLTDLPGDVHYLTFEELRGLVRGTAVDVRPRPLVVSRKREAARAPRHLEDRLETEGVVATATPLARELPGDDGVAHVLRGVALSSGEKTGRAVVVRKHEQRAIAGFLGQRGPEGVVVVDRLDAGLLPLLAGARAVVVESAGVLDHVAVALRSLGIPVVGGIARATEHIESGEPLHVNGDVGRVHLLRRMPAEQAPSLDLAEPEDFARLAAPSNPEVVSLTSRRGPPPDPAPLTDADGEPVSDDGFSTGDANLVTEVLDRGDGGKR